MTKKTFTQFIKRENNNLDFIRFLLSMMVFYCHIPVFRRMEGWNDFIGQYFNFTYSGAVAVICFFFISGLLVSNSLLTKNDYRQYLVSRFLRIYPGLIVVCLFSIIIGACITTAPLGEYLKSGWSYLYNQLTLSYMIPPLNGVNFANETFALKEQYGTVVNGSLWSITWEIRCYILLLIVHTIACKFNKKSLYSLLFGTLAICACPGDFMGTTDYSTLMAISAFFIGCLVSVHKENIPVSFLFVLAFYGLSMLIMNMEIMHLCSLIFLFLFFTWLASTPLIRKIKMPKDISYGIYIWGWPIQALCQYMFPHVSNGLYITISVTALIGIGYLSARFIEEPCMRFSNRLCKKIAQSCYLSY